MSQTWTDNPFDGDDTWSTDLQAMENNFAALKSCFSGATAPADPVAGMQWYDTTKKVTKRRDSASATWYGLMHGDASQKIWVYRNSAMEGWAIDSSVSDVVLAAKGGSTYTAGGAASGTWTQSGHIHLWGFSDGSGRLYSYASDGTTPVDVLYPVVENESAAVVGNTRINPSLSFYSYGGGGTAAWRPAAAVNTLQYLDL